MEPGWAGIKVDNYGDQRGVEDFPVQTGRVWYNPITQDVYKFPTFQQHYNWRQETNERGDVTADDSFVVNSMEGAIIGFDVATAITIQEPFVPSLFVEFRRSPSEIVAGYVRSLFEREFTQKASTMRAVDIVGEQKAVLVRGVEESVGAIIGPKGMNLDFVTITGEMRLDEQVEQSINAVLTAAQRAIEARNRVVQSEAEADQAIASARGDSASAVISAQGQAEANRILRSQLSPELIEYESVRRWNGVLPSVTGGSVPFVNVP